MQHYNMITKFIMTYTTFGYIVDNNSKQVLQNITAKSLCLGVCGQQT